MLTQCAKWIGNKVHNATANRSEKNYQQQHKSHGRCKYTILLWTNKLAKTINKETRVINEEFLSEYYWLTQGIPSSPPPKLNT